LNLPAPDITACFPFTVRYALAGSCTGELKVMVIGIKAPAEKAPYADAPTIVGACVIAVAATPVKPKETTELLTDVSQLGPSVRSY
jgi:hypothetical protein